jgi:O-antigen ligase
VGYGNYGFFFYDYRPGWGVSFTDVYLDAFPVMTGGFPLRLLTETSIPGVLAFIFLVIVIIAEGVRGWRAATAAGDAFMEAASAGLMASFITLMVRLMAADSIHFTYQWFIIAMLVLARRLPQRQVPPGEVA